MSHQQDQRREVHFTGHVQGVGFRFTTQSIAANFAVTGFVRNLADGRVQVVAEGTAAEIQAFLAAINDSLGHYIRDTQTDQQPATGHFPDFQIRY